MAEKVKKNEVKIADLHKEIEELKAKNKALHDDCLDLQKQNDLLVKKSIDSEDRYNEERKLRVDARNAEIAMEERATHLATKIQAEKEKRVLEQAKRHASITKFVIVAAVALVVLLASFMLQKITAIGPSVGYTIQCGMSMIIAWCYALIWDRSRKN
jgi:FtsZ-binding cell division protein ZapB